MTMTPPYMPTGEQQQNAVRMTIGEILRQGFSVSDAQPGKLGAENVLFFNAKGNPDKNQESDLWIYATESMKQAATIERTATAITPAVSMTETDLTGLSFSDGNDRLDITDKMDDNLYSVKRIEDHPFINGKKALRSETWNAGDLHAAIAAGLLQPVQTYSYTSKQQKYDLPEMQLLNHGLIRLERTDTGSLLTFDHPVTKAELHLGSLTPTPETAAMLEQTSQPQNLHSPSVSLLSPSAQEVPLSLSDIRGKTESTSETRESQGALSSHIPIANHPNSLFTQESITPIPAAAPSSLESVGERNSPPTASPSPSKNLGEKSSSPSASPSPLDRAGERSLERAGDRSSSEKLIAGLNDIIGDNGGFGISYEPPVKTKTAKGIEFEVEWVIREKDGSLRLYGSDEQRKERSVGADKVDKEVLGRILSEVIKNPPVNRPDLFGFPIEKRNTHKTDEQKTKPQETPSLGSEARKILSLSKVHAAAKKDHPEDLVFIRVRDYETKKFMYQTFGKDTELLTKTVSPSVEILRPEIKGKTYPTVSLYQGDLSAIRNGMMAHHISPVIINAKGEKIDNDHFLAITPEDIQSFNLRNPQPTTQQPHVPSAAASPIDTQPQCPSANLHSPSTPDSPSETKSGHEEQNSSFPSANPSPLENLGEKPSFPIATPSPLERAGERSLERAGERSPSFQYEIKQNSHVKGYTDIRLYVNGEKVAGHRLSPADLDRWRNHQVGSDELINKYFQKELNGQKLESVPAYNGPEAAPKQQSAPPAHPERERYYTPRINAWQQARNEENQKDSDRIIFVRLTDKENIPFYQTFGTDALKVSEMLNKNLMTIGNTPYLSVTAQEMERIHENHDTRSVPLSSDRKISTPKTVSISPASRIEYAILPTTELQQLKLQVDGKVIGIKPLTEKEYANYLAGKLRPAEMISQKFSAELGGNPVNYKQLHLIPVSKDEWDRTDLPGGHILNSLWVKQKNHDSNTLVAKIDGQTISREISYREAQIYFDKAMSRVQIVTSLLGEQLSQMPKESKKNEEKPLQNVTEKNETETVAPPQKVRRETMDQAIGLWEKQKKHSPNNNIVFVERNGERGLFYQTFETDAKNLGRVLNKPVRIRNTESHENLEYISIPKYEILDIMRSLGQKGFFTRVVNLQGELQLRDSVESSMQQTMRELAMVSTENIKVKELNIYRELSQMPWKVMAMTEERKYGPRNITDEEAKAFAMDSSLGINIVAKYFASEMQQAASRQQDVSNGMHL